MSLLWEELMRHDSDVAYVESIINDDSCKTLRRYIFGISDRTIILAKKLINLGFDVDGFAISEQYYNEMTTININDKVLPVKTCEVVVNEKEKICLITTFAQTSKQISGLVESVDPS